MDFLISRFVSFGVPPKARHDILSQGGDAGKQAGWCNYPDGFVDGEMLVTPSLCGLMGYCDYGHKGNIEYLIYINNHQH